jgi:hypothetical protein
MSYKQFLTEYTDQCSKWLQVVFEGSGFTIDDLRKDAPSPRNIKFYKERQSQGKTGSFIDEVGWNEDKDVLTVTFKTTPTYDSNVKTISNTGKEKSGTFYTTMIQFEDVNKYLGSKKDFFELSKKEQNDFIKEMVKEATVKVHANDLSYFYQGTWENADALGFAIKKFPGPKGKGIWSKRHRGESPAIYITKHLIEILTITPFLINTMGKMLR